MAKYFTDFSEYDLGVQPSDWTEVFVTSNTDWTVVASADVGVTNGVVLRHNNAAVQSRHALKWDAIDADEARATVEIVFKAKHTSGAQVPGEWDLRAMMRASGSAGSETGYVLGRAWGGSISQARDGILKYDSGDSEYVAAENNRPATTDGAWYWTRARASGTSLMFRRWLDGDPEPSTWDLAGEDSAITAAGWVGLFNFNTISDHDIDCFGVGTAGNAAPMSEAEALPAVHEISGDLVGPGSSLAGSIDVTGLPTEHVISGALVGPGSALSGAVAREVPVEHVISGNLVGPGSALSGTVRRSKFKPVWARGSNNLIGVG